MGSNNQRIEFYCYIVRNNQYFSMSQKMKYTVFLFLLHFMQTNSQEYNITKNPQNTVWMINAVSTNNKTYILSDKYLVVLCKKLF